MDRGGICGGCCPPEAAAGHDEGLLFIAAQMGLRRPGCLQHPFSLIPISLDRDRSREILRSLRRRTGASAPLAHAARAAGRRDAGQRPRPGSGFYTAALCGPDRGKACRDRTGERRRDVCPTAYGRGLPAGAAHAPTAMPSAGPPDDFGQPDRGGVLVGSQDEPQGQQPDAQRQLGRTLRV